MKNYGQYSDNKDISTKGYDISAVEFKTVSNALRLSLTRANGDLTCLVPQFNQDTTGNSATATKLAASKNLWGRAFDGSADVTGALTNTGSITPQTTSSSHLGSSSLRFHTVYAVNGNYTGTMSITGATEIGSTLSVVGNVGLGTAADSTYKLSVSGKAQISGVLNANGGILIDSSSIGGTDHLVFNRATYNYIRCSAEGGSLHFITNGKTVATANSDVTIKDGELNVKGNVIPAATRTYDVGSSSVMFNNVYTRFLDTAGNYSIRFCVNGSEYMNLSSTGLYIGAAASEKGSGTGASYKLHVVGNSMLNGTTYLGNSTTYYIWNGSSASKLYSLTVGSATALSVSSAGKVAIANESPQGTTVSYSSSTAALKVAGGAAIQGNLGLYSGVYFGNTGYYFVWDSSNNAIHTNANFYSDGWIASGGIGSAGGGGGGGVNVNTYAQIQAGTATGVASENSTYVPTSYALRQTYVTASGLSTTVTNLRAGGSHFTALLMRNTNNSPTITFQGEYDNNLGANITLGTLSGYRATISSTTYTGLSVGSDFFVPNGKHIYTYTYGGAVRSVVYYPTANYDELRFGDISSTTRIYGSSINLGETTSSVVNVKGVTSINGAVNITGVTGYAQGIRIHPYSGTSSIWFGATNNTGFDAGMWGITVDTSSSSTSFRIRGTATASSTTPVDYMKILNGGNVEFGGDIKAVNIIGSGALKYRLDNQDYDVLYHTGSGTTNALNFGASGVATKIQGSSIMLTSAVTIDSNTIGGADHLVFNRNSINYIRASHADGSFMFITNGKAVQTSNSALRINQYGISIKTSTAPSSSYALRVNGNSILSGTLTVGGYSVKGKKTYDLTTLFTKNSGTAIDTIGDSSVEGFLNDICNGYATLFTTEQKTFNGSAFSPRFDVHVAYMQSNFFALYYARMGGTPPMYFEVVEITYDSGWKISTRKTVTLN